MNMVKRRGSITAKPVIKNFDEVKTKYLTDIKTLMNKHNIPPELIIMLITCLLIFLFS
jgi:uncharacterized protein YejL (UPF0352 family)